MCTVTDHQRPHHHRPRERRRQRSTGDHPSEQLGDRRMTDTYNFSRVADCGEDHAGAGAGQKARSTSTSGPRRRSRLTPDFVIPAGTPAGSGRTADNLPADTTCTVTRGRRVRQRGLGLGHRRRASHHPRRRGRTVSDLHEYSLNPGSLVVTKTIAGDAGGSQGPVTIPMDCDGRRQPPDFVIPAGARRRLRLRPTPTSPRIPVAPPANGRRDTSTIAGASDRR